MGVNGLWHLIESTGKPVPLESLESKILSIDISIWLHQSLHGFRDITGSAIPNAHILGLLHRICKILFYNVKPVFVFDGGVPSLKKKTMALRRKLKSKAENEKEKTSKQIVMNLLRQHAMKVVAGPGQQPQPTASTSSPKKDASKKDLYQLDPMPSKLYESSSSSDEEERALVDSIVRGGNIHSVDFISDDFKALPPELQHEVLLELKDTRKQNSWGKLHLMPNESGSFSNFQMSRLLKRRALEERLTEVEESIRIKQMDDVEKRYGSASSGRLVADETTRFILLKDFTGDKAMPKKDTSSPSKRLVVEDVPEANSSGRSPGKNLNTIFKKAYGKTSALETIAKLKSGTLNISDSEEDEDDPAEGRTYNIGKNEERNLMVARKMMKENDELTQEEIMELIYTQNEKERDKDDIASRNKERKDQTYPELSLEYLEKDVKEEEVDERPSKCKRKPIKERQYPELSLDYLEKDVDKEELDEQRTPTRKLTKGHQYPQLSLEYLEKDVKEEKLDDKSSGFKRNQSLNPVKGLKNAISRNSTGNGVGRNSTGNDVGRNSTGNIDNVQQKMSNSVNIEIVIDPEKEHVEDDLFADVFNPSSVQNKNLSEDIFADIFAPKPPEKKLVNPSLEITKHPSEESSDDTSSEDSESSISGEPQEEVIEKVRAKGKTIEGFHEEVMDTGSISEGHSEVLEEKVPAQVALKNDERSESDEACSPGIDDVHVVSPDSTRDMISKKVNREEQIENSKNFISEIMDEDALKEPASTESVRSRKEEAAEKELDDSELNKVERLDKEEKMIVDERIDGRSDIVAEDDDPSQKENEKFAAEFSERGYSNMLAHLKDEKEHLSAERGRHERIATTVTDQMYQESKELLRLFGLPYVTSPMEAEAQCAFLDYVGLTHGTITDDSDIWLFGGQRVYRNFFNNNKFVEFYKSQELLRSFSLTRQKMVTLAILAGSDYTPGIFNVGPVTAMEIMSDFPGEGLEQLQNFKAWWDMARDEKIMPAAETRTKKRCRTLFLSKDFPDPDVIEAYLHPEIDSSTEKFKWGRPDVDGLREFIKNKLGWSQEKLDPLILPVIKKLQDRKTQMRIDSYFAAELPNQQKSPSKRVQRALYIEGKKAEAEAPISPAKSLSPKKTNKRLSESNKSDLPAKKSKPNEEAETPKEIPLPRDADGLVDLRAKARIEARQKVIATYQASKERQSKSKRGQGARRGRNANRGPKLPQRGPCLSESSSDSD